MLNTPCNTYCLHLKRIVLLIIFNIANLYSQTDSNTVLTFDFNEQQIKEKNNLLFPKAVGVTLAEDRFGNENSAVYIHGNNSSYLNLGTSALLKPQNLTISLWVKIYYENEFGKGYQGNPIIVTKSINYEDFNMSYAIIYDYKNDLFSATNSFDSLNSSLIYGKKRKELYKWYHLVISFSKTEFCFYVNGKLENKLSKKFQTKYLESDSVLVGHSGCKKNQRYLIGSVDDIQFFHRVLSEKEVLELYHEPNPNNFKNIVNEFFKYGIIIAFFVIIIIIIVFQNKRNSKKLKEKFQLHQKISELEIKNIKAQMNPHFISNSMAAIQDLILKSEIDQAGQYIAKLSLFMRLILDYSDKTFITLAEEINMIKLNVELEQLRFKTHIEFSLDIPNQITLNYSLIPALITQPFIENAIWHGLLPLNNLRKPKLKILIKQFQDEKTHVEIEDNGVGRQVSQNLAHRKSRGTSLMKDKIESLNKLFPNANFKLTIIDLKNEELSIGTKVIIEYTEKYE